jgi:hypothetical protein
VPVMFSAPRPRVLVAAAGTPATPLVWPGCG